jgi:L,D-peptidoglycan transpeptidase YkuD (ErfK/YbiS/YcfS/YnhG family)
MRALLFLAAMSSNVFAKAPNKLVVVVTDGWSATAGEMRRYERAQNHWRPIGEATPVVLGKSGLKWPKDKREGDGASPAGRFLLGEITGYDEHAPAGAALPYRAARGLICVDDPARPDLYNRVTTARDGVASFEEMYRKDALYELTIFVRHNDEHAPKMGSCIFLHVWRDAHSPTVGCTAMALDTMRELVHFVDGDTKLVQLPREEYRRLQHSWDLPAR